MMRRMLTIFVLMVALAPAPDAAAGQRRDNERATQAERITKTLTLGADGELDVSNIAGDITVTRAGGTTATVDAVKTARAASADEAREMLGLVTVDILERGTRAELRTTYPGGDDFRGRSRRNVNVEVTYTIAAPPNTRLVIKSISGNIDVRDIMGPLTLDSVSGTVRVANAGRVAGAKSISGDVEVLDTRIDGALEAGSISGTVRVRRTQARSLSLSSVSGGVVLEDVTCDRIEAQSISADVNFSGEFAANGRYEFTSHSGNIRVAVGSKVGFQVEATSFSGTITSDLPLTLQGGQSTGRRQRSLRGTFGNGSAVLELTAFSGGILITKR